MEKKFRAKFLDKEIIEKRKNKLREQYRQLEEGVFIGGEIIEFERQEIFNGISMMIPTNFEIMPEKYAQIKFTSSFRPQHLITSPCLNVNFGFSIFPDNFKEKDLEHMTDIIRELLHSEAGGFNFGSCEKLKNFEGYWFNFRTHATDQIIYNMLLIVLVKQRILQATFNCSVEIEEKSMWSPIVRQMWETIEEENKYDKR